MASRLARYGNESFAHRYLHTHQLLYHDPVRVEILEDPKVPNMQKAYHVTVNARLCMSWYRLSDLPQLVLCGHTHMAMIFSSGLANRGCHLSRVHARDALRTYIPLKITVMTRSQLQNRPHLDALVSPRYCLPRLLCFTGYAGSLLKASTKEYCLPFLI